MFATIVAHSIVFYFFCLKFKKFQFSEGKYFFSKFPLAFVNFSFSPLKFFSRSGSELCTSPPPTPPKHQLHSSTWGTKLMAGSRHIGQRAKGECSPGLHLLYRKRSYNWLHTSSTTYLMRQSEHIQMCSHGVFPFGAFGFSSAGLSKQTTQIVVWNGPRTIVACCVGGGDAAAASCCTGGARSFFVN